MLIFKFLHKKSEDNEIRDHLRDNIPSSIILGEEIDTYMHGVDSAIVSMPYNPHMTADAVDKAWVWNRGFWDAKDLMR